TLAAELPEALLFALDISPEALQVAQINANRYGVREQINWLASDLCSAFREQPNFDLCCANPPYIAQEEEQTLAREVSEHEPKLALFAPEYGLGIIRRLVEQCSPLVRPGGYLLCEIGFGQEEEVLALIDRAQWEAEETVRDLQNISRTLVLKRRI